MEPIMIVNFICIWTWNDLELKGDESSSSPDQHVLELNT
jgi:hypothetical protein